MLISNNSSLLSPKTLEDGNFIEREYFERNIFLSSFVYDNDFEGKRFTRFMQKTESKLYQFMIEKIPVPELDEFTDIYAMLKDCICTYIYNAHTNTEPIKKGSFLKIFWNYVIDLSDIYALPEEIIEEVTLGKENIQGYELPLTEIIMEELKEAAKYYIMLHSISGKITKEIYMKCVPTTAKDCMFIIQICLNRVMLDVERCLRSFLSTFARDMIHNNTIQKNNAIIQKQETEIEKLKKQLDIKDAQIHTINQKKEELEKKLLSADYKKDYTALYHEKEAIAKKCSQMEEKYQKLKEEINSQQKEVPKIDTPKRKLNKKLKYLFVVNSDIYLAKTIQEVFPNSTIKIKNITTQIIQGMDAVVFITGNIKHSDYYKTRNICKNSNVPYVHSCKLNIEQIITDMEQALKEERFYYDD